MSSTQGERRLLCVKEKKARYMRENPTLTSRLYGMVSNFLNTALQGALVIGRMPLMLRSCRCVLSGKSELELAKLGPYFDYALFKSGRWTGYDLSIAECIDMNLVLQTFQVSVLLILAGTSSSKGLRR